MVQTGFGLYCVYQSDIMCDENDLLAEWVKALNFSATRLVRTHVRIATVQENPCISLINAHCLQFDKIQFMGIGTDKEI